MKLCPAFLNAKVTNEDIKWESIYTWDVGVDMEFFRNRLAGVAARGIFADNHKTVLKNTKTVPNFARCYRYRRP